MCILPALLPPLYIIVVFTSPHLAFIGLLHSSLCQLHGACICMVHVLQGIVCQLHVHDCMVHGVLSCVFLCLTYSFAAVL